MSGPIVRKYGFPNFESIFGKREMEHGVDEGGAPTTEPAGEAPVVKQPTTAKAPKGSKKSKS